MVPLVRLDPLDVFVDLDQQKMRPLVTGILRRRRRRRRLEGIVAFPRFLELCIKQICTLLFEIFLYLCSHLLLAQLKSHKL